MKSLLCTLILTVSGLAATAKADTLSIVVDQSLLYGAPNTTVNFTGTITNISSAPVYISGAGVTFTTMTSEGYGIGPSYPFGMTTMLAPGASTGDTTLLNVGIPANPDRSVTFAGTLEGGATPTSNNELGSFSATLITSPAPVPEIDPSLAASGIILLAGAITILRARRADLPAWQAKRS